MDGDAEWAFRDGDDLPAEVFDDMVMNKLRRMHRDEIDEEDEEDEETSSVAGDRRGGTGHVEEDEDDDLDLDVGVAVQQARTSHDHYVLDHV